MNSHLSLGSSEFLNFLPNLSLEFLIKVFLIKKKTCICLVLYCNRKTHRNYNKTKTIKKYINKKNPTKKTIKNQSVKKINYLLIT